MTDMESIWDDGSEASSLWEMLPDNGCDAEDSDFGFDFAGLWDDDGSKWSNSDLEDGELVDLMPVPSSPRRKPAEELKSNEKRRSETRQLPPCDEKLVELACKRSISRPRELVLPTFCDLLDTSKSVRRESGPALLVLDVLKSGKSVRTMEQALSFPLHITQHLQIVPSPRILCSPDVVMKNQDILSAVLRSSETFRLPMDVMRNPDMLPMVLHSSEAFRSSTVVTQNPDSLLRASSFPNNMEQTLMVLLSVFLPPTHMIQNLQIQLMAFTSPMTMVKKFLKLPMILSIKDHWNNTARPIRFILWAALCFSIAYLIRPSDTTESSAVPDSPFQLPHMASHGNVKYLCDSKVAYMQARLRASEEYAAKLNALLDRAIAHQEDFWTK
eukprot:GEMP01064329.1.p1 GENE.GEMP01064329.1~~GEMP01064329.1.p1  ORF type:complete len:385 (+),score=89.34 GEMP01064329.1:112-1266(+)